MNTYLRIMATFILCIAFGTQPMASPLFDDETSLTLTIEAPMRDVIMKRASKPVFDTVVRFKDSSGTTIELHGQLAPRGNARLEACEFPPLQLILKKSETRGTVFEGQDDLKIVTQCNTTRDAETWLLQEYGIYRAYNIVTDYSYRVRRLEVTYLDSTSSRWSRTQPAFFIESTGELAKRMQLETIRPPAVGPDQFNRAELTNNVLFQLLIANTDFAMKKGPTGEGCCHNGRVLTEPGQQKDWVFVPYDFDQAGIIKTNYALPDQRLGIRAVTTRLYRGFCWQSDYLPAAMDRFRELREEITTALIPQEVSPTRQKRIKAYIGGFYKIIDDPNEMKKRIADTCRGPDTYPIRKTRTS
ncbi:MAG: hypothetical protein O3A13_05045 [Proteobacteria bacterium]|nr:hypothetical protein [Pseudomonadota bacterium]MDA0992979.1 hypothetical protein [Pseudomonadota bacterium]